VNFIPCPDVSDTPVNITDSVTLSNGQQATITFSPAQGATTFHVPVLAASKRPNTTYEVRFDGASIYGPSQVPPTDVDDLAVTWAPARGFSQSLELIIQNVSAATTYDYTAQIIGWEES